MVRIGSNFSCFIIAGCLWSAGVALADAQGDLEPQREGRVVTYAAFPTGELPLSPREVRVLLPEGYDDSDQRHSVLYVHDGGMFESSGLREAHDQLVEEGVIPPAILVGIHHADRSFELTPPRLREPAEGHGGLPHYLAFIRDHVKPLIDREFRTRPGRDHTGVIGASYGGLASFLLAYQNPELFGMAGCFSPALGYDEGRLFEDVKADERGRLSVRFYFDAGPWEGEMPAQSHRMASLLIDHGWEEGADLAWYHDPRGLHTGASWATRARSMLAFLLREQSQVQFTAAWIDPYQHLQFPKEILPAVHARALKLWIDRPSPQGAILQLWSPLGVLRSAIRPDFDIADPSIVEIDSGALQRLRPRRPGATTLRAEAMGHQVAIPVIVSRFDHPNPIAVESAPAGVTIDGRLDEWWNLPHHVVDDRMAFWPSSAGWEGPRDGSFRFAVACDNRYVYIAADVTDDTIVVTPGAAPWSQDGIEIRFDARPAGVRSHGMGEGEQEQFVLLAVSPGDGKPHAAESLPEGTQAVLRRHSRGYSLEARLPASYLDQQQEAPWTSLRINVVVNDQDVAGGPIAKLWWQPDWRFSTNVIGSGTFCRPLESSMTPP